MQESIKKRIEISDATVIHAQMLNRWIDFQPFTQFTKPMMNKIVIVKFKHHQRFAFLKFFKKPIKILWVHFGLAQTQLSNSSIFNHWKVSIELLSERVVRQIEMSDAWLQKGREILTNFRPWYIIMSQWYYFEGMNFSTLQSSAKILESFSFDLSIIHFDDS